MQYYYLLVNLEAIYFNQMKIIYNVIDSGVDSNFSGEGFKLVLKQFVPDILYRVINILT